MENEDPMATSAGEDQGMTTRMRETECTMCTPMLGAGAYRARILSLVLWLRVQVASRANLSLTEFIQKCREPRRGHVEQLTAFFRGSDGGIADHPGSGISTEELLKEYAAAAHDVPPDVVARLYFLHGANGLIHLNQFGLDMQHQGGFRLATMGHAAWEG
jgi:hypothetical protein